MKDYLSSEYTASVPVTQVPPSSAVKAQGKANPASGLNMRSQPSADSSKVTLIPFGATMDIVAKKRAIGTRYPIMTLKGYVLSEYVDLINSVQIPAEVDYGTVVSSSGLNLRAAPSADSDKVTIIPSGAKS